MNNQIDHPPSLLVSCLSDPLQGYAGLDVYRASSGQETLHLIRMFEFALLLSGLEYPDIEPWTLLSNVVRSRGDQKWGLVAPRITDAEEIRARALGAIGVFDCVPPPDTLFDLIAAVRRRDRVAAARPGRASGRVSQAV